MHILDSIFGSARGRAPASGGRSFAAIDDPGRRRGDGHHFDAGSRAFSTMPRNAGCAICWSVAGSPERANEAVIYGKWAQNAESNTAAPRFAVPETRSCRQSDGKFVWDRAMFIETGARRPSRETAPVAGRPPRGLIA
jgi:hypothetical protein